MTPVQEYFFDNNIEVWSKNDTGTVTYFNTSDGEFLVDDCQRLFKIQGNKKTLVHLLQKDERVELGIEELTNFRREQLILKLTYAALVQANLDVTQMESWMTYREGGRLNWRLVECKEQAEELSMLYDDLVRSKVKLVETSKLQKEPTPVAAEVSHNINKSI